MFGAGPFAGIHDAFVGCGATRRFRRRRGDRICRASRRWRRLARARRRSRFSAEPVEVQWRTGQKSVKVMQVSEGFCYLTSLGGELREADQEVGLRIGEDECWYLDGDGGKRLTTPNEASAGKPPAATGKR